MTLHAFVEYLKYTLRSKGRHGTHSPFVYDFVEHVLQDKDFIDKSYLITYRTLPLKYENLVSRIAAYYKYRNILFLPQENVTTPATTADMLLLTETKPQHWAELFDNNYHLLPATSAVIVIGIHNTILHTIAWRKLCADPRVRMSIDMYGIGMLLFREEFKIPQHFILKY